MYDLTNFLYKFSDVLPSCTCARATGNLRSICFGANTLSRVAKSERPSFPCIDFNENIPLLKALRVNTQS